MTAATAIGLEPTARAAADTVCAHCGAPAAAGARFCCTGCETAFDLVRGLGLDSYYERRKLDPAVQPPRPEDGSTVDPTPFAEEDGSEGWQIDLAVHGLHCAACVWLIESVLAREPAVRAARLNATTARLHLAWTGQRGLASGLAARIAALGYRVAPLAASDVRADRDEARSLLFAMVVAGFAAANVMLLSVSIWAGAAGEMGSSTRTLFHWLSAAIALPALLYSGRPFALSAWAALRAGRTNMDVPITIGVFLTAAVSLFETVQGGAHAYFESSTMLVFFLLVGRYLDRRARGKAKSAVMHFLSLSRAPAMRVKSDGSTESVAPEALRVDDIVRVASGEKLPADGILLGGETVLDTAVITGEALPHRVAAGDLLHAGTVNLGEAICMKVTALGDRTLVGRIAALVTEAEAGRAAYRDIAERISRRYAPTVHALAAFTFAGWLIAGNADLRSALLIAAAVLIITCPCALALAVPTSGLVAAGRLARRGVLLKSSTALERLAAVDTIVFDKTGTLTLGRPQLVQDGSFSAEDLAEAASLALSSRHPLSRALVAAAPHVEPAPSVQEVPGLGLKSADTRLGSRAFCSVADGADGADGVGPELWLARPGKAPVCFRFHDALRPDAVETVRDLTGRGYRIVLLSGDREVSVRGTADALEIREWRARCLPADKAEWIAAAARDGGKVLMVGDGLNDAPALAAALASIAPAQAMDATSGAADAVFQGEALAPIADLLDMARATGRIARQNLVFALGYNLVAVPLAILGLVTPLIAAIAMSSSSLVVVGNALRLRTEGRLR